MEVLNEDAGAEVSCLHDVCNVEELRKLLKSGADVNETNNFEETPLLCALRREIDSPLPLIQEFLTQGADLNAKDVWGVTPLYCALARHGKDLSIIKLFLENGADIESGKRHNDRFLDHFVTHNRSCAELIIKYKFLKNSMHVKKFTDANLGERNHYTLYKMIVDLDLKPSCYNFLASYLDDCASEILQMKSVLLCTSFTLLDFVLAKAPLESKALDTVQQITNKIYKQFLVNNYRIYKDMIIDKLGRKILLKKLDDMCILQSSRKSITILNLDIMYYVAKYLSETDLFDIIIAFFNG